MPAKKYSIHVEVSLHSREVSGPSTTTSVTEFSTDDSPTVLGLSGPACDALRESISRLATADQEMDRKRGDWS